MTVTQEIKPVVVTGSHRSGTTWVGKMLALHPALEYVHEPLNCNVTPATWGVLPVERPHWYQYIAEHNEAQFGPAYRDLLRFRYAIMPALQRVEPNGGGYRPEEIAVLNQYVQFAQHHLSGKRPLIKDPFALVSVPWFVDKLGAKVIVTIRHPAAFVSSLLRLGWSFGLDDFLAQPELLAAYPLEGDELELNERFKREKDEVRAAVLGWRYLHRIILSLHETRPDVLFVRHEDLSLHPLEGFTELAGRIGLELTPEMRQEILKNSSGDNPLEHQVGKHHQVNLDSAASIKNWKKRLTPVQIEAVREVSGNVADALYKDEEW